MTGTAPLSICLTCSHGGHLTEMRKLEPAFAGHHTFYICYDAATTRELEGAYRIPNMARNPIELLKNLFRATRIFMKERPDVIVSTGAEIALPVVAVGKLFGAKTVYIECGAQVSRPSFTGRVMYYFADAFFVQWPELLQAYGPRAQLRGSFVDNVTPFPDDRSSEGRGTVILVNPPSAPDRAPHASAAVLASVLQQRGYVVRVVDAIHEGLDVQTTGALVLHMDAAAVIMLSSDSYLQNMLQDTTRAHEPRPLFGWGIEGDYGLDVKAARGDFGTILAGLAKICGPSPHDALPIDMETPPDWALFGRRVL